MPSMRATLGFLRATLHRVVGAACYHLGAPDRAQRHMQRVLELKGDDFTAYVYLGRVAYGRGDYVGWRRECEHARRTAPERFARLRHPFELHRPRTAETVFEEAGERASWRTYRVTRVGTRPGPLARLGDGAPADDFASEDERARFRGLPPVLSDEIRRTDLEDLARRLSE